MNKELKSVIALSLIAITILIASAFVYGQCQFEAGLQTGRHEALRVGYESGYEAGFQDGQLEPAKEVESQIHNRGFEAGWKSGLGQPTEEFLPETYIILVNLSQDAVYKAQGVNRTSRYVYQIISYHLRSPVDGSFNESLGAGWSAPEFVMIRNE